MATTQRNNTALDELRKSDVMAHLLDSLDAGKDIGHYGRLVFAMVAWRFLPEDDVVRLLQQDNDFNEADARALYLQVKSHDYSPPKREKLLDYQAKQDFPIIPNPDDPDSGNLYRDLQFPDQVYEHISEYYEEKAGA
ncbi:hypothetical protein [Capsulimonas corticalis]|nr:hypothetical protein [Capsulimonas corticalis]